MLNCVKNLVWSLYGNDNKDGNNMNTVMISLLKLTVEGAKAEGLQ